MYLFHCSDLHFCRFAASSSITSVGKRVGISVDGFVVMVTISIVGKVVGLEVVGKFEGINDGAALSCEGREEGNVDGWSVVAVGKFEGINDGAALSCEG